MAHQRADYERPPYKVASPHPSLRDTFPEGEGFKTVNCRRCHFDRSEGFNPNAVENPPRSASRRRQVGWRGYASGISFPRDCHVATLLAMTAAICVFACFILSFRLFYDVISTEAGVLTRTQRRNPPRSASRRRQVGWRVYASGISFPRDCHVARCAPRNDKAVRNLLSLPPRGRDAAV